jgi:hypothetical protein
MRWSDKKEQWHNREKDFHFEYHALLQKLPSEIAPFSDLPGSSAEFAPSRMQAVQTPAWR